MKEYMLTIVETTPLKQVKIYHEFCSNKHVIEFLLKQWIKKNKPNWDADFILERFRENNGRFTSIMFTAELKTLHLDYWNITVEH